ncbi:MAG: hypothetical protein HKN58_06230, partial [Xanthomonadales bacterium]|nr:hypothetical protein [Xanthomonadales bacterium]
AFPTLVLHIGAGKTGSTSIQFTLRRIPQVLEAQGTGYVGLMLENVPGATEHAWCAEGAPQKFFRAPDREATNEEVYQTILAELKRQGENGARQVIWSNEAFLTRHNRVLGIIEQLARDGVPIRPIVYVRRHDKWARSAYVQFGLKFKTYTGPLRNFRDWAAHQNIAYTKDLDVWRAAFPDQLEIYNFDAIGDVATHFMGLVGLTDIEVVRANDSPSNALLAAWSVFNGRQHDQTLPAAFTRLAAPLQVLQQKGEPVPPLDELLPDTSDLMAIQETYRSDLEAVNALLVAQGQPPMDYGMLDEKSRDVSTWEIDRMLFQMVFSLQRQVLELQERLEAVEQTPGANRR